MINIESFGEKHIRELQMSSKRDPALLERTIYALGLLEALSRVDMPFVFKGGTCLLLLLAHPHRLSTDIDIIVKPGTVVDDYIKKASTIFPFTKYEEQVRIGKNLIEKRHFKFTYESPISGKSFYILLDVLYEENNYEKLVQKKIKSNLLITEPEYHLVTIPSIECLLADKLTAFAPHTTGIPLNIGKNMEIMKQMYDIGTLLEELEEFSLVKNTYDKVSVSEIAYRGIDVTPEICLLDTLNTAKCIVSRGKLFAEEYPLYVQAIRDLRGHIYADNFTPEIAIDRAAKVAYMAACMLTDEPYEKVNDYRMYVDAKFVEKEMMAFKYLRKANPEAYAYMIKTDMLMAEFNVAA